MSSAGPVKSGGRATTSDLSVNTNAIGFRSPIAREIKADVSGETGRTTSDVQDYKRQNHITMALGFPRIDKAALLSPTALARAAALRAKRPEERWLLRQPRRVRTSYVRKVLEAEDVPNAQEMWLLRQATAVRESYIREVLG